MQVAASNCAVVAAALAIFARLQQCEPSGGEGSETICDYNTVNTTYCCCCTTKVRTTAMMWLFLAVSSTAMFSTRIVVTRAVRNG